MMKNPISAILFLEMLNMKLREQPDYHPGLAEFSRAPNGGGFVWPDDLANDQIYQRAFKEVDDHHRPVF